MQDSEKATVISIVPFQVVQKMPGIYPGDFIIPPAPAGEIRTLTIGQVQMRVPLADSRILMVDVRPMQIAESIVNDFIEACIVTAPDAHPGLFPVQGVYETSTEGLKTINTRFGHEIAIQRGAQLKWFNRLVQMADDDWTRYHQNRSISDIQRHAATALGHEREWLHVVSEPTKFKDCPACLTRVPLEAVVCATCRTIIDHARFKELKLQAV